MPDVINAKEDTFVVVITEPLSDYHRNVINTLYTPIMGAVAYTLYNSLYAIVPYGKSESEKTNHYTIIKTLNLDNNEFLKAREALEAMGLLDVYTCKNPSGTGYQYLYLLKEPLTPYAFLNDDVLSAILITRIGDESFMKIISEYLVHRYNICEYTKVTKAFDEVYKVETSNANKAKDYHNWWVDQHNNGLVIDKKHFDYEYYAVLMAAVNVISQEELYSKELYNEINRLAFVYLLTAEDLKDATIKAVNAGKIDYDLLRHAARRIYEEKYQKIELKRVETVNTTNSNKLINVLENLSPIEVVTNKYATSLTGSEVEMFDKLLRNTNISTGMLNVLILYVMDSKNGEIPSYNYFLKIINTWIRAGITNTEEALNYLNNPQKVKKYNNKEVRKTPDWYNQYREEVNEALKQDKAKKNAESKNLDELEKFFSTKK